MCTVGARVELAQVWDVETGKKKFARSGQQDYSATCCLAAGGKELVVLGSHGQAGAFYRFDATDGKELGTVAITRTWRYEIFRNSAMRNAAAPSVGGESNAPMPAAERIAPPTAGRYPARTPG